MPKKDMPVAMHITRTIATTMDNTIKATDIKLLDIVRLHARKTKAPLGVGGRGASNPDAGERGGMGGESIYKHTIYAPPPVHFCPPHLYIIPLALPQFYPEFLVVTITLQYFCSCAIVEKSPS